MKTKLSWIAFVLMAIISAGFTVLISKVDVQPIGPLGTKVGLAEVNGFFSSKLPFNTIWYQITQVLGIVAIFTALLFALLGLLQLIHRESIWDVDTCILTLAVLYVLVIFLYILFEKFIVNYRPVIMPDSTVPEASFPSTHTMLICSVMGSAIIAINRVMKAGKARTVLQILCVILLILTVAGRMLSGVHWFTDIIGGVFISTALVLFYQSLLLTFETK